MTWSRIRWTIWDLLGLSKKTRAGVRFFLQAKREPEPRTGTLPEAGQGGCQRNSQEIKPRISKERK